MQRDQHIATIEKHGRIGWQRRSGYNRRSLVETAMYRYKTIIGRRRLARTSVRSAGRSKDWMQRAEPDDKLWYAGHHQDRLMSPPAGTRPAALYSRNKARERGIDRTQGSVGLLGGSALQNARIGA